MHMNIIVNAHVNKKLLFYVNVIINAFLWLFMSSMSPHVTIYSSYLHVIEFS